MLDLCWENSHLHSSSFPSVLFSFSRFSLHSLFMLILNPLKPKKSFLKNSSYAKSSPFHFFTLCSQFLHSLRFFHQPLHLQPWITWFTSSFPQFIPYYILMNHLRSEMSHQLHHIEPLRKFTRLNPFLLKISKISRNSSNLQVSALKTPTFLNFLPQVFHHSPYSSVLI